MSTDWNKNHLSRLWWPRLLRRGWDLVQGRWWWGWGGGRGGRGERGGGWRGGRGGGWGTNDKVGRLRGWVGAKTGLRVEGVCGRGLRSAEWGGLRLRRPWRLRSRRSEKKLFLEEFMRMCLISPERVDVVEEAHNPAKDSALGLAPHLGWETSAPGLLYSHTMWTDHGKTYGKRDDKWQPHVTSRLEKLTSEFWNICEYQIRNGNLPQIEHSSDSGSMEMWRVFGELYQRVLSRDDWASRRHQGVAASRDGSDIGAGAAFHACISLLQIHCKYIST